MTISFREIPVSPLSEACQKPSIVLLRTPVISSVHSFSAPVTPPLALTYLAASLIKVGHEVVAIDALGEAIDQIKVYSDPECRVRGLTIDEIISRISPRTQIIALSCMFSQEWLFVRKIIKSIKEAYPHIRMVVGGEHANAMPENILETCPEVDLCALGEGEEAIVDIANYFPVHMDKIPGIVYRAKDGKIYKTRKRERILNIEDIPRPAWHLFPMENYLEGGYGHGVNAGRTMPILATRGCPFQCTFCSNKYMWEQKYYTRPPIDVIDEIEQYKKDYNIDNIDFYDLTAIIKKDWILEFGRLLKERDVNISWSLPSGTRSEALDESVTKLMAETHCKYLVYAAESGSARTLKLIKKKVNLDKMLKSMRAARKNGLVLRCNLMLGFPKEKRIDVWKTLFFQIRLAFLGVEDVPLYMFSPYPGSELFDYLRSTGRIVTPDDKYFQSLLCQMDLTQNDTYCENIGSRELGLYRFIGMGFFYAFSYLIRPWRISRSLKNIFDTKKTDTVFEQRIVEMLRAKKQMKASSQR